MMTDINEFETEKRDLLMNHLPKSVRYRAVAAALRPLIHDVANQAALNGPGLDWHKAMALVVCGLVKSGRYAGLVLAHNLNTAEYVELVGSLVEFAKGVNVPKVSKAG